MLPLPLAESYDYRLPAGLDLAPGQYVSVPLGSRTATGIVWETDVAAGPQAVAEARLKDVEQALDVPPMPAAMRRFIEWVADYTLSPPGSVLRMAMSVPAAFAPPRPRVAYRLAAKRPDIRLTPARVRVLALLSEGPPRVPSELQREAGVGGSVLRGLVDAGAVEAVLLPAEPSPSMPDPDRPGAALSPAQGAAAADLAARVEGGGFSVALLDGVTGSGKTEVYFEAIAAALQRGRQVLVMLPEIALSAQWLERFAGRFGTPPVEWHSDLTQARRRAAWRAVAEGRARVVVGARSALFLPFPELGLIVVDEEHDSSFKQEDGVIYHARDMAVVRARIEAVPIVLVSATPSLESMVNGAAGRYDRLHLPARHGEAELPEIVVVDLRRDAPDRQSWLSPSLKKALVATLAAGEQALLFLNRRGYAPLTLCRACGHRLQCPNCTAWLVEHRLVGYLECHHCGHRAALPQICPECGTEGRMAACGPGVERLAEEVAALHPEARLGVLTSDTIQGPTAAAAFLRQVRDHQVDILIGTQIVAKGHHFPMLTLVGVVDADLGLAGGDLRAGERTYQLLSQVAGRAGREERPGLVLLQTWHPDHPVMTALRDGDRDRFLGAEAAAREAGGWPPYGRLAAVIVSGPDIEQVDRVARELGRAAPRGRDVHVLGPAPAPLALLRGRHRRRLLLKAARAVRVQPLLRDWLSRVHAPSAVRVQVDIDPYSFL